MKWFHKSCIFPLFKILNIYDNVLKLFSFLLQNKWTIILMVWHSQLFSRKWQSVDWTTWQRQKQYLEVCEYLINYFRFMSESESSEILILIKYIDCDLDILGINVQRTGGLRNKLFSNMYRSQPMYYHYT